MLFFIYHPGLVKPSSLHGQPVTKTSVIISEAGSSSSSSDAPVVTTQEKTLVVEPVVVVEAVAPSVQGITAEEALEVNEKLEETLQKVAVLEGQIEEKNKIIKELTQKLAELESSQ
jgi:hypothetical protein